MKNLCRHKIWKTTNCIVSMICVIFLYLNILTMDILKENILAQNRPFWKYKANLFPIYFVNMPPKNLSSLQYIITSQLAFHCANALNEKMATDDESYLFFVIFSLFNYTHGLLQNLKEIIAENCRHYPIKHLFVFFVVLCVFLFISLLKILTTFYSKQSLRIPTR